LARHVSEGYIEGRIDVKKDEEEDVSSHCMFLRKN
jgi:hypothetical protein